MVRDTQAASFRTVVPKSTETPYSTVTVITHGLQFVKPLEPTFRLGEQIANAGGGGVVLEYNPLTGQWANGKLSPIDGRPLVLIVDWSKDTLVPGPGYLEAAADAVFAALGGSGQTG